MKNKTNFNFKKAKLILTTAIVLCSGILSFSQNSYFNVKLGYDFASGKQNLGQNVTSNTTNVTFDAVSYSLGKGHNIEGTFGYMFQKYVGAELGISYLKGTATTLTDSDAEFLEVTTESFSSIMIKFIPSIVITPGLEKINPYAKVGAIIGANGNQKYIFETKSTISNTEVVKESKEWIEEDGLAIGFKGSLGMQYFVGKNTCVIGEVNITNLSYSPKKQTITKFVKNGVDVLPTLTVYEKQIEYLDSITQDGAIIMALQFFEW